MLLLEDGKELLEQFDWMKNEWDCLLSVTLLSEYTWDGTKWIQKRVKVKRTRTVEKGNERKEAEGEPILLIL